MWIIGLEYRTNVEQLKNIRNLIKEYIDKNQDFANDGSSYFNSSYVRIDSFADSSIDMLVQCFTKEDNWDEFLKVKEKLAIKVKEIIENEKAGFAFPSQSIYVESLPGDEKEIINLKQ